MRVPYSYDKIRDKPVHKWVFGFHEDHDAIEQLVEHGTKGSAYLKKVTTYKWRGQGPGGSNAAYGKLVTSSVVLLEADADQLLFQLKFSPASYRGCHVWENGRSPLAAK